MTMVPGGSPAAVGHSGAVLAGQALVASAAIRPHALQKPQLDQLRKLSVQQFNHFGFHPKNYLHVCAHAHFISQ